MAENKEDNSQRPVSEVGAASALPSPEPAPLVVLPEGEPDATAVKAPERRPEGESAHEFRWKYADAVHRYIREYIALADQKAAFFFAAAAALLGLMNGTGQVSRWVKSWSEWALLDGLSFLAVFTLTLSAIVCVGTILPRRRGSRRGIVFFGAIAEFNTPEEYVREVVSKRPEELVEVKLGHVRELAVVCTRKYDLLRVAIWSGSVGAALALLLLLAPEPIADGAQLPESPASQSATPSNG